uniref:CWF19 like cell cycle control factor 2 n=1 Tax=Nothobranchius furzeri TaxID=105023 RepID=A0A8C6KHT0_NOTFU
MATYGVSFESSSSIDEKKEKKRQSREEVLEKAKQQYEKEERRKELKRLRGEDTWILPEVNQRLQQIEEEGSGKSKKKKEKKSKKKKKKAKKEKVAEVGKGSSDSSQRDEWMTFDFLAMRTTSTAERRAEKDQQKEAERAKAQAIEQAGLHKLELNPYWKDGGTGLPPEENVQTAVKKVNDGGLSWLRKNYQRMKEQAEREQRSLSDVVAERYGVRTHPAFAQFSTWCNSHLKMNVNYEDQEVLLFRTDQSGRAWPVKGPTGPQEPHGGRRKKKPMETHVDGQRVRYFQDDDSIGLQEMVRREKMSSAQDQHALYSRMAAKMMGKMDGDNYTLDDMFVSSAAQREGEGREEERMRSKAIAESRRLAASMDKCQHCFNSKDLQKHLIVAIGSKVYLSLPAGVSMTEGQCLICPLQHHCSATGLDEDIWSEMQLFRRALVRMFEAQELDCVFMETHITPRRRQHMVLECIPLPRELGDMAPIYFKKAIMECDEEWAMNKKIVDLSSKDIRQAVPRGLPYFAVDFGLQGGFAHVIENEQKFPHYFGKEVVGGMMDLEPRRWRKPIRENFDDQRKKVLQFAQWWKPYDCTKTQD